MVRRVPVAERRARLGVRHALAPSAAAGTALEAARRVVVLHATDPATVFLSVLARWPQASVGAVEQELYENRALLRMLGMRRTVFVVPAELAPVVQASSVAAVAARSRRTYTKAVTEAGVGDAAWLAALEDSTLRALEARGEATAAQLSSDEPRLRTKVGVAAGKPYGGDVNVTTWVLAMLAADGRIARGRPLGSWTSTQYRWAPMASWLPGGLPDVPVEDARTELVRAWLRAFGPGTLDDLVWWTGWNRGQVRLALSALETVEVDLDGVPGLLLTDDLDPVPPPEPWVALLPALDPTPMGWQQRSWFLGPSYTGQLFDRTGNIGPTVWVDGRVVGGWAQRASGQVVVRLLEDVGREASEAIDAAAARVEAFTGGVRVVPRFRTPLERELSA